MIKYPNSNATPASAPASKGPQVLATLAGKVTVSQCLKINKKYLICQLYASEASYIKN